MSITPFPRRAQPIPGDLATLQTDWLDHRRARGASGNTLSAYGADLNHFRGFLGLLDITLVQLVSEQHINRWLDDGVLHLGWSRRTAARKSSSVRTFFAWVEAMGYIRHNPSSEVRIKFRPRRVIAPEMDALVPVIEAIGTAAPVDLRDRAMLMLLLDAALRAGEVVGLDIPDRPRANARAPLYTVQVNSLRVHVRPKGDSDGSVETVGIEPQTVEAVRTWLHARPKLAKHEGEHALFLNGRGARVSRHLLYTIVRRRGAAVGMPELHPHLFRHRRVGDVVEKLGLDVGSAIARHACKATTVNVYGAHAAEVQRHSVRTHAALPEVRA